MKGHVFNGPGMAWLTERKHFISVAFDWMKSEEPLVIGRSVLPKELLTETPDDVVSAVANYLMLAPIGNLDDVHAMQAWLTLGAAVVPHSSDPDFDLQLVRVVSERFATAGYAQPARDLVEAVFVDGTTTALRRRLGWFAVAEVYHRCRNYIEGLVAMACMLFTDAAVDDRQSLQEIIAIARFLRDCGSPDEAQSAIQKAREMLKQTELSSDYSCRLDTLDLQVRQMRLAVEGSRRADVEQLLFDAVRNGAEVLEQNDMTAPVATLVGQLLRQANEIGATIPTDAYSVFAELSGRSGGTLATQVSTFSASEPTADALLSLVSTTGSARYSDDVGYDMRNVAIAASRALNSSRFICSVVDTSFALELLADRGVAMPNWDEAAMPPPVPETIEEPSEISRSISEGNLSVLQVGFDDLGRVVRVNAVDGRLDPAVRESDHLILKKRFDQWSVEYPFAYGTDETTTNLFYTTTANLRLSSLPKGPVVVIADVRFQPFPPNLIYVDAEDNFAGRTRPMAAAPSLGWLKAAGIKGVVGDGRRCVWISTAVESGNTTLAGIADRLKPTFEQYRFDIDSSPRLPIAFAGASLAVVTAHGGIQSEGRYFQVVSDEGRLRVTAADLADSLRNIGVVVLFVCSGGRTDKHPSANTTLGLAKQILDRGCAAVIASPWPLDSRVPAYWLPEFMKRWSRGERLIEANFAANQVVDEAFSYDPARGLAMTILGDPRVCSPPSAL